MLEMVVIVIALGTLVRGKFSLGYHRVLSGWRARVCGGILLLHLVFVGAGIVLSGMGVIDQTLLLGVSIVSLVSVILGSAVVGNVLYKGQVAEYSVSAVS